MFVPAISSARNAARPWMLMPLLGLLWGSSYLWIAVLAGEFGPFMVILLRTFAALAIIGTLAVIGRRTFPPFGRMWLHLLVVTVAADLLPFFMLIWAQKTVASSVAAVLNSTIPLFTLLIAALVFRSEKITRERMIGILLGIGGVAALSGSGTSGNALLSPGVLAVTVSSVFYGFGFVYARRYVRGDSFAIVAMQMMMTVVLLLPLTLALGTFELSGLSPRMILAVIGLGTMSSGLAYAIYYMALERLGPTVTSYATYLSPVVALLIGWLVLNERISPVGYAGILVIAAGVLTASGLSRAGLRWFMRNRPEPALVPAIVEEAPAEG